jgi:excisionase family DNA binding protein
LTVSDRRVAHLLPPPLQDKLVTVMIPERWMHTVEDKLQRVEELLVTRSPPPPAPANDGYISREEAARVTGFSGKTIKRLEQAGKLRTYGPRRNRLKRSEVDAMMAAPPEGATVEENNLANAQARLHADDKE